MAPKVKKLSIHVMCRDAECDGLHGLDLVWAEAAPVVGGRVAVESRPDGYL